MIENVLKIQKDIEDLNISLVKELDILRSKGYAFHQYWYDKYGSYSSWVISENKELLSKVRIDGWSDDNGYAFQVGPDEFKHLPCDHPELIRINDI